MALCETRIVLAGNSINIKGTVKKRVFLQSLQRVDKPIDTLGDCPKRSEITRMEPEGVCVYSER